MGLRWFYDLRVSFKLGVAFASMVVLVVAVGALGLSAASSSNTAFEAAYRRDMASLDLVRKAEIERLKIARTYRTAMLAKSDTDRRKAMSDLEQNERELTHALDQSLLLVDDPDIRARTEECQRLMPDYGPAIRSAVGVYLEDPEKAAPAFAASQKTGLRMELLLRESAEALSALSASRYEASVERLSASRKATIAISLGAVIASSLLAVFLGRVIGGPLQTAVTVLETVARGDLTVSVNVTRKDEVGRMAAALNATLSSMNAALTSVQRVSLDVSASAAQLAASAAEIASGAQAQAASLEEAASSLEEISSAVGSNTDSARKGSDLASSAAAVAERGGTVTAGAVSAMNEITSSSKKIGEIISTVDEIAFQTNLLALNAAVEAARAGEQGRGFAVVAAEVRTLAGRSGDAAKEIRSLIAESSERVAAGTRHVDESGRTLQDIVRSVRDVATLVGEIASASGEQKIGLDQVNIAVSKVDEVTQRNAGRTEELSTTAHLLSEKSSELQSLVSAFELRTQDPPLGPFGAFGGAAIPGEGNTAPAQPRRMGKAA